MIHLLLLQFSKQRNKSNSDAGLAKDIGGVMVFLCNEDGGWIDGQRIEISGGVNL